MRDVNRIPHILEQIGEEWKKLPDWRLMQLICNFQRWCGSDGFYIEDDRLVEKLKQFTDEIMN